MITEWVDRTRDAFRPWGRPALMAAAIFGMAATGAGLGVLVVLVTGLI